ncbi:DUF3048 domain-containing protein [Nocardioides sp. AE5]|uniref:DUF3048 domain-containing protein n=1 Tax=Nocardioides sp. AE5 TaxID=2962573 RepID=UPI002880C143|nr:DUF3048 domain-containing protein [Nocardioides sp. AE5]MDT0201829.1 DUF3048 domain-containing protein [Nocardioides sp. AE5]
MRRLRLTVAALATASMVLAGCGGGDDEAAPPNQDSSQAPETTPEEPAEPATWPLTGLPVEGDGDGSADHPVYVVKVDNTGPSRPQVGLGSADLVVEELVEGGSTRLAVFFYSQLPEQVGPVRSMRASDIGIVKPVAGEMVTSGAASKTYRRIQQAGITWHEEGTKGISRDRSRRAPYNVMANLATLASAASGGERPADYLVWGDGSDLPDGEAATTIAAKFSGGQTSRWTWTDEGYALDNDKAGAGDNFVATNVLVVRAVLGDAGYKDPAGNPVPETKFEGSGEGVLFHGGKAVEVTWSKDGVGGQLKLETADGAAVSVPAGKTWIELVPTSGNAGLSYQ